MPGKDATSPNSGYYDYASLRKNSAKPKFVCPHIALRPLFCLFEGKCPNNPNNIPPTEVKHKHSAKSSKVSLNFHLALSLT